LTIFGDDHDNSITLRYSDDDQVLISGNHTRINGTIQPLALPTRLRNVSIHLGNGDNWLEVSGLILRGNLNVQMFKYSNVQTASGDNSIYFQNLFAHQFSVNTCTGNDTFSLENLMHVVVWYWMLWVAITWSPYKRSKPGAIFPYDWAQGTIWSPRKNCKSTETLASKPAEVIINSWFTAVLSYRAV